MKTELRLPRMLESDPRGKEISDLLTANLKKLHPKSHVQVVFLPYIEKFIKVMQFEHKRGRLVRGLESIERNLELQSYGLSLADEKSTNQRGSRVSRLLIISSDGADRFLRKVEALLADYSDRLLGIVLDIDSETLGQNFFGEGKAAKLIMIEHKESVSNALFALSKASTKQPTPNDK